MVFPGMRSRFHPMKRKNIRFSDDFGKFCHFVKGNSKELSICSDRHHPKILLAFLQTCYFFQNEISLFQTIFHFEEIWFRRDGRMCPIRVCHFTFHPGLERHRFSSKTCHFEQGWIFVELQKCTTTFKWWTLMILPYQADMERPYELCKCPIL